MKDNVIHLKGPKLQRERGKIVISITIFQDLENKTQIKFKREGAGNIATQVVGKAFFDALNVVGQTLEYQAAEMIKKEEIRRADLLQNQAKKEGN